MGLLTGRRVIEIGTLGAWGTKLLGDLGAEVILIEPPAGSPARRDPPFDEAGRSLSFAYFNTNKQSLALDLADPADRDRLRALAARSDALVESLPPGRLAAVGLGPADLAPVSPGLVYLSISPFGQSGPRRDWAGDDLIAWATGGPMALCGLPDRPPLCPPFQPAQILAGTYAAIGLLAAWRERDRSGHGQAIDLSLHEAVAAVSEVAVFYPQHEGTLPVRLGTEHPATVPLAAFPTRDGHAYVIALSDGQWEALLDWMAESGAGRHLRQHRFLDQTERTRERDLIHAAVREWVAGRDSEELFHEGQRRRIPIGRVNSPAGLCADRHLAARGFWVNVPRPDADRPIRFPGAPAHFPIGDWAIRGPAPSLDADRGALEALLSAKPSRSPAPATPPCPPERALPLAGFRVIDLTWVWAGPFATSLLADLGADVIKVEGIGTGDYNRHAPPFSGGHPDPELAGAHLCFNRNKRSVTLNLRQPEGLALLRRLIRGADALIENFSAGTLERMGLDEEVLRADRPDLIVARLSGFGQDGPHSRYVSFAPALQGLTGITHLTGYEDGTLAGPGIGLADFLGGLIGAFCVLAAADGRARDGRGRTIDVGQFETAATVVGPAILDYAVNGRDGGPGGNRAPAGSGVLRLVVPAAGDDRWVALSLPDDAAWDRLIGADGIPVDLARPAWREPDRRAADAAEIEKILGEWTRAFEAPALMDRLQAAGVPAGAVQNGRDLLADPHLRARGYWVDRDHPRAGTVTLPRSPLLYSATPPQARHPGPLLGQHTDEVLTALAEVAADDLARLRAAGVIG